jgi:SLOG family YspA-like protein
VKVLVCGSRTWTNWTAVLSALKRLAPDTVIHGGCPTGADSMADRWAKSNGVPVIPIKAEWGKYGRAAGPKRNRTMLDVSHPDLVLAFGYGRGTNGMVKIAEDAGVKVERIVE